MLRPATPLTILLFAAFCLLLISVLSTPIIKQIPLASFGGVDFGVFGYCKGTRCTSIEIGFDTESLYTKEQSDSFNLKNDTRKTLSTILIVHPIAALLTLILLVMAASAHFHSPSHSPRYLLGIFILSILTLVASLLSFLIDVLLFVPHMAWGSYIVLAATILIGASGIVSCAMRRTLVSRKARKRRIAENAEMNGENFYNRQGPEPAPVPPTSTLLVDSHTAADKLPAFATFDVAKNDAERQSDERIPLTQRTPSENSSSRGNGAAGIGINDKYGGPPRMGDPPPRRDQYGNIIPQPPPGAYGMRSRDPSADPSLSGQRSDNSMGSRGRGGFRGGPRGGGYPPNGRGGSQRGGYGGPPRGGGYGGPYGGGPGQGGMMGGGRGGGPPAFGRGGYDNRGQSPGGYGQRRPSPGPGYSQYAPPIPPANGSGGQYAAYNPDMDESRSSLARAESPPPMPGLESPEIGQTVDMDARTGIPSAAPNGFGQLGNIRESDNDVAGMIGIQQQRLQNRETIDTEASRYSTEEAFVPPRQVWEDQAGRSSPLNPTAQQPAGLQSSSSVKSQRISSASGDHYYEDVDPRFAEEPPTAPVPRLLSPGYGSRGPARYPNQNLRPVPPISNVDGSGSYEDLAPGARSPAESDRSTFTSVSQRGVNPRWNGGPGYAPMPTRRPAPQRNDLLLNSNPDFQLPGNRGGRRGGFGRGGRGGTVPNSAYPGGG